MHDLIVDCRRANREQAHLWTYKPLDEDHVWAIMTWAEQDVGGGHLTVEVAVRNMKAAPKPPQQLESDAKALAIRFVRAFADLMEH
jgi:hypothetical protein